MSKILPIAVFVASCAAPVGTDGTGNTPVDSEDASDETDTNDGPEFSAEPTLDLRFFRPPDLLEFGTTGGLVAHLVYEGVTRDEIALTWESSIDDDLPAPTWGDEDGEIIFPTEALSPGTHQLRAVVTAPDGTADDSLTTLDICQWPELEDFSSSVVGNGWITTGDAYWEPSGWLEITGNTQSHAGAIYKIDRKVNAGDVEIAFRIATGGGINGGADGYAVNVIDVPDAAALRDYVQSTANGGCLGYGITPGCGGNGTVNAFHIEFDTWYNAEYSDPTQDNHVAILLDGDPATHYLSATIPSLEDLQWRDVVVTIRGAQVIVTINGATVIDGTIPGFRFDGGYLGISGSTGWATNWHRFDNLLLRDRCLVP